MFASLRYLSLKRLSSSLLPSLPELPLPLIPSHSTTTTHQQPLSLPLPSIISLSSRLQPKNHGRRSSTSTSASSIRSSIDSTATSSYSSVRIRCRNEVADMLSEALLCFGASSVSIDELDNCDSIDELDNCDSIDEICISSIFTEGQHVGRCISHAADSIGLEKMPSYEVEIGEQCNWEKNALEMFRPVKVTDGLWIIPEWTTPPDAEATNIVLNPGLAFGTGEHPTTKLCLLLLHGLMKGREYFLDYGTGSGILAIAALKLGAALSVGIDIDPQAITSARRNAALNGIKPEKMQLYLASGKIGPLSSNRISYGEGEERNSCSLESMNKMEKFDIVIANILLNPLIELADHIVAYAKPGAVIGISGILSEQISQIEECVSQHLDKISVSEMDGWACISGIKRMEKVERNVEGVNPPFSI